MSANLHHAVMLPEDASRLVRSATWAALIAALLFLAVKLGAWWIANSLGMLAILIDAMLDSVSSIAIFIAVRYAQTPADAEHRFGHGKAEALASIFIGGLMAATTLFLLWQAIERLLTPQPVTAPLIGVAATAFVIVMLGILILYQNYVIRKTDSLAIQADSLHYRADFLLHLSVIVGLAGSEFAALPALDALCALGIALYIAYEAAKIVSSAADQLLDRELSEETRDAIRDAAQKHPRVSRIHDLRTRRSGQSLFVQMHIELPADISLKEAHEISDEVEEAVSEMLPGAEVLIHQDPEGLEKLTKLEKS